MGQLGELSPQASVAVGILVGLLSTSVQSLGLTLQRKSHVLEDEKGPNDLRRPPHRRRRWQLGMFMFIIANLVGSTIQITTLPLPVLSTLQASGLVFNSICASLILGEPFTRWSLGGTFLVSAGAVLIAIFGAIGEPAHNLDQLLELLGRRQFILWMIGQAILVVMIIIGAKSLKWMNPWTSNSPRMRLFRGMAYGAVSGILSAHSLLVAKSAVELLVRTIVDRHNEFNRWQSWMILLGLLALALTQLYYLHRGLKLCSTSILYPFVFCVYNINAILDGLIYFDQSSRLSLLHALLIALGTLILLLGVLALSWRLNNDPTTRPPVSQNPLTPGMGFVVDDSDSEAEANTLISPVDEEAALPNGNGKESPFLHHRTTRPISWPHGPRTPTMQNNDILSATRLRRKGITESEEIWEELEDNTLTELPPFSQRRISSVQTTPHFKTPMSRSDDKAIDEGPNESSPLLSHSGTGRNYRDKRRRRSAPMLETLDCNRERDRRRKSVESQEAVGGWWKMKSWWYGSQKGKAKGKGPDNGNENGNGASNGA
ncbi:hypothetical protein ABVK25_003453 [Lepraria finkii]|uniref:Uncharacterized protein n=1 Tax=Lepraria finkii TaxID=1340010 RepID=A0ABR4BFI5_9LECA